MHILIVHQAFAAIDEAGGTRHHELARMLAQQGHKVTIIASPVSYLTGVASGERIPWLESQDGGSGVEILRAYTYAALHRSFFHRVLSFISFMASSFVIGLGVHDVDLVWGTSPPIFQGLTAWALARLKRAPFLFEVRDLWPAFAVAVGVLRSKVLISASEWLERFLYRHADRVLVNSPGFVSHVRARGARDVRLVPNGVDTEMFDPDASGEQFRRNHALESKYVVMYAGAHGMSNDLDVVLEAAAILRDKVGIAFVFIGDGKEKPRLVAEAERLDLNNVHFISPVPKKSMGAVLAGADACLAILKPVDLYKTVYPNKVFDYMAAAKPVILAIDGVIREVVENAGAGVYTPPGDPHALAQVILTLYRNPESALVMGKRGRAHVTENFDRRILAQRLGELITEMGVVNRKSPRGFEV